ncbi:Lipid-binding serum glycoprotein containing protein [Cricetulus griseus]|uniref:Lipid-binding serum glycoprotein containing protein n=1 Tax=Cricetulus griseus TaxID=10029 RepID=A0A061HYV4_CRIGR|nr:Lipid-binding serum glycoprotein containing protein [Cricetulus griseus]
MLLPWTLLLCWGLLHQARGMTHSPLFLRISWSQLETDISDLFTDHQVLKDMIRMPVTGSPSEGVSILDPLPFVRKEFVGKKNGLDLSLVGDLLSGKAMPELKKLLETAGLVIEDAKGPEVTLEILSDSLLQITLRCKLYLSLLEILWIKAIKNIRIGVRLEQIGNKTQVAFEECHTPPGSLNIEILNQTDTLLPNQLLKLVTEILEESLPFLLQKIVCPVTTNLLNFLLEDLLYITLPPVISGPNDFQYYLTSTEFTEEAILMRVQETGLWELLSQSAPTPQPEVHNLTRGSLGLIISTPDPPAVHLDGFRATVTQQGLLMLQGTNNVSSGAVVWQLLSKAVFSSRSQKLKLQFMPHGAVVTLGPYPTIIEKQEGHLKALLLEVLKRRFLPHHNQWLREHDLPLPNIKGISFSQAQMDFSENYILLTIPE